MAKKVLSIRVDNQKTLVSEIDLNSKHPHVYRCISFDTPEDVVEDGFITNSEKLAVVLKEKLKEAKCTEKNVIFTVTSSKIANREVALPLVSETKLKSLVATQASEYFPFDLQEYVLAYMVQNVDKRLKKKDLLLFAAPNDLIQSYYDFAKAMAFHLIDIDYDGNSSYQIMRRQTQNRTSMAIQINLQNTIINIMQGDQLILQRSVPYGFTSILDTIMDFEIFAARTPIEAINLLADQHIIHTHLKNDTYKNVKVNESMLEISDSYRRNLEFESARMDITESFTAIINNFNRVIDYYHSNHAEHKIKEIILTGIGSNVNGILDLISNELGIETKIPDELLGVTIEKKVVASGANPIEFVSCIGAVISPIGFVSKEIVRKEEKRSSAFSMSVVFGMSMLVAIVMISVSTLQVNSVKSDIEDKNHKINSLGSVKEVFNANATATYQWTLVQGIYNFTVGYNDQLHPLLTKFGEVIPTNMSVVSMNVADNAVSLNMEASDKLPSLSELLIQLESIEMIENVAIGAITKQEDELTQTTIYSFSVTFNYKVPVSTIVTP